MKCSTHAPSSAGTRTHEHIERGRAHRVRRDLAALVLHSTRAQAHDAPAVARDVQDLLRAALLKKRQYNLRDERGRSGVRAQDVEERILVERDLNELVRAVVLGGDRVERTVAALLTR